MKDEIDYFREGHLLEEFNVDLAIAGLSEDGSRFMVRNGFSRPDGKPMAKVTSVIGWLDLSARKLVLPPATLLKVLRNMPRSDDFRMLPTSLK